MKVGTFEIEKSIFKIATYAVIHCVISKFFYFLKNQKNLINSRFFIFVHFFKNFLKNFINCLSF